MWTFCPHLGSFCVISSSLRFGQISPLAFFRWLTVTSDRNFGRTVVKKKQHKNYQDEGKKSSINKKLILRLRNFISQMPPIKDINILLLFICISVLFYICTLSCFFFVFFLFLFSFFWTFSIYPSLLSLSLLSLFFPIYQSMYVYLVLEIPDINYEITLIISTIFILSKFSINIYVKKGFGNK